MAASRRRSTSTRATGWWPLARPRASTSSLGRSRGPAFPTTSHASSRARRHPRLPRHYERWLRQPLPAELAQCRAPIGLEAGDVRTRRGDAELERLPPVLEGGVLDVHRDGGVDDVADSGHAKEVGQVAGPAAGADRPSLDLRIERLGRIPER